MPHVSNPSSYLDDTKAQRTDYYPHFQMKRLRHRKAKEAFGIMHCRWTRVELESYPSNSWLREGVLICKKADAAYLKRPLESEECKEDWRGGNILCLLTCYYLRGDIPFRGKGNTVNQKTLSNTSVWSWGEGSVDKNACHISMDSQHPHKSWVWCSCNPRVGDRQRQADPQLTSQRA